MKKITLIGFLILSAVTFGQITKPTFNRWSIDAAIGTNTPIRGFTPGYRSPLVNIGSFEVGGRFMFNANAGIQLGLGFDQFNNKKTSKEFKTNYGHLNLQAVINLGNVLNFYQWTEKFSFLAHAGVGLASMTDNGVAMPIFGDDQHGQLVFGLTPQFKLSRKLALNLDVTGYALTRQNHTLDYKTKSVHYGFGDYFIRTTAGVSYYLGSFDQHADWSPTKSVSKEDMDAMRAEVEKMRKAMKDDDRDGVPNYLDEEPNTPEGTLVDQKGKADPTKMDTDRDGIPDSFDACPELEGKFSTNGCPDMDGDGVADKDDKCPSVPGSISAGGCPQSNNTPVSVTPSLDPIYFDVAKATMTKKEMEKLNRIVDLMNANPNYTLIIKGHADNMGSHQLNQELSEDRAQSVLGYLMKKGIDPVRLKAVAYGSNFPKSTDKTNAARQENRRVEFEVRN